MKYFIRCLATLAAFAASSLASTLPTDDPAAAFQLPWTSSIRWTNVLDVTTVEGASPDEKLATAQRKLAASGGGVVYFPPGEYKFREHIELMEGIVLRGAPPAASDARKESYQLTSRIEFPKYQFKAEGAGTPNDSAFKSVRVVAPAATSNCGIVHMAINRGHVNFGDTEDGTCGRNRLVIGCILTNTAHPWVEMVPNEKIGQHAWQRYNHPFGAAIEVKSAENLLIAHNRMPRSGEDDFTMNGYVLQGRKKEKMTVDGVVFDYDNRPGIYANHAALGGPGGSGPDGTPETHPTGFRKGTVIHGNYVFCTGRCAISFSGDGTVCSDNVIRFAKDVWRPTPVGLQVSAGSSTNDNRAVEMRGWRWKVTGNDYEVHSNLSFDKVFHYNDGEGIMHEDHCNSTIKDSVLTGNKGNRYLSLYWCAGIDGLLIENNEIELNQQRDGAIWVDANRVGKQFPIRNVTIRNNRVNGAIRISGSPGENNVVSGNRFTGTGESRIDNFGEAKLDANTGFSVNTDRSEKEKKMFGLQ